MNGTTYTEGHYTSRDGLRLYYRIYENGESRKTPLLCIHGLTRNSKDFHGFAGLMQKDRTVISVDVRGRGQSDHDPEYHNYQVPTYVADMFELLAHLNIGRVINVGTSMGGLISMAMAMVNPGLLKGIVLNDIGPEIDQKGLDRISGYVGKSSVLKSWKEAANIIKMFNEPFFPDYTDEDWLRFAENTFREQAGGGIVADYDMQVGTAIRESQSAAVPVDMWPMFESMAAIPVLCLRGEMSDLLSPETLQKMTEVHPDCTAVTILNRGHTPDLTEHQSLEAIGAFLDRIDG